MFTAPTHFESHSFRFLIIPNALATVPSRRLSEIITPPSPEPIYDEVAAFTTAAPSKRWSWTAPPPPPLAQTTPWRSLVMEITPLPTLPSAGPSSPAGSSLNGTAGAAGGVYSSVYYDSVVTLDEEDECEITRSSQSRVG